MKKRERRKGKVKRKSARNSRRRRKGFGARDFVRVWRKWEIVVSTAIRRRRNDGGGTVDFGGGETMERPRGFVSYLLFK